MRRNASLLMFFMVSMVGGMLGAMLFSSTPLQAQRSKGVFSEMAVYNQDGVRIGLITPGRVQQGTMWLFDDRGEFRIQMGTYENPGERGQPLIGMHDNGKNLRALMRLHGDTDSPVIVMKDKTGYDRLVMGLRAGTEEPYLEYTNADGEKIDLLKK
ncbi:MAG TPA: hypothetical protein EYG18_10055 [Micavibrio sp.]|nr:hypothetical protein [Pseudomonadota bacterium]MEC8664147.1 hypothetical protein [Pseudomonadota bacterium]HIF26158.1 hypothetical protein [Micavibrio sp.]HIL29600.1 hypothetical protein [Micavibrio sp.]